MDNSPVKLSPNTTEINVDTPLPLLNIPPKPNRCELQQIFGQRVGKQELAQLSTSWSMKYEPKIPLTFDTTEEAKNGQN